MLAVVGFVSFPHQQVYSTVSDIKELHPGHRQRTESSSSALASANCGVYQTSVHLWCKTVKHLEHEKMGSSLSTGSRQMMQSWLPLSMSSWIRSLRPMAVDLGSVTVRLGAFSLAFEAPPLRFLVLLGLVELLWLLARIRSFLFEKANQHTSTQPLAGLERSPLLAH